jgi:hypothetical protein
MILINSQNEVLEHISTSYDYWYYDYNYKDFLDDEINKDSVLDSIMDVYCSHLNYWLHYKEYENTSENQEVEKALKNINLLGCSNDFFFYPERLIIDFSGEVIYGELSPLPPFTFEESRNEIIFDLKKYKLIITKDEFEELGGEIYFEEEGGEVSDLSWSSSIYYFMTIDNQDKLESYLFETIDKINSILKIKNKAVIKVS